MNIPNDPESIRIALEQAAAAAYQRAQAHMENMNTRESKRIRRLLESAASEAIARAQEFEIPRAAFQRQAEAVEGAFVGLWPILKDAFLVYATLSTIFVTSLVTYGLFYLAIQPGKAASEPLYFDYSRIAMGHAPICSQDNTLEVCQLPSPTPTMEGPWAFADFFSKETQWEAYHQEVTPRPRAETRILRPGNAYYFEIGLELPESEINRRTGMFMVHVDLQSSNGTRLASSIRAGRLPHETEWVSTVRKSIWLMPLMIGAVQETRRVVVPSFRHYVESGELPLRYATVRLVMQEKDRKRKPDPLEVIRGEIRIGKELTDFQFLLREWFFTCYIVGTLLLSLLQLGGLFVFRELWKYRLRQQILRQMQDDDLSEGLSLDEAELEQEVSEWEDLPQSVEEVVVKDEPVETVTQIEELESKSFEDEPLPPTTSSTHYEPDHTESSNPPPTTTQD